MEVAGEFDGSSFEVGAKFEGSLPDSDSKACDASRIGIGVRNGLEVDAA